MMKAFDGGRCLELVKAIWENDRFGDFRHFRLTADVVENLLREAGAAQVESLPLPADGRTRQLDWAVPRAWDARDAGLVLLSEGRRVSLCDYASSPLSVMMFSDPLPRGEYTVVPTGCRDWRSRLVYTPGPPKRLVGEAADRGAVGIVSDYFPVYEGVREADDPMEGCCRWENDLFYPRNDKGLSGFSLSRTAGARLREELEREGTARVEAWVDARSHDGEIRTVSGLIPGKGTEEEILLCAHLYEPGANDNASGCALLCHLAECLSGVETDGFRRGVRLVMGYEAAGMSGFIAAHPEIIRRAVVALNCDMVGAAAQERALLHIWDSPATNGTFAHSLLTGLARRAGIRYEEAPFDIGDCLIADPLLGVPCCSLVMHPANSYHSALDTPERVDPRVLEANGRLAMEFVRMLTSPEQADVEFVKACLEEEKGRLSANMDEAAWLLRAERQEAAWESFERWIPRDSLSRVPRRLVPGAATLGGRLRSAAPELDPFYSGLLNTALFHADGRRNLRTIVRRTCAELSLEVTEEISSRIERFFEEAAKDGIVVFDEGR